MSASRMQETLPETMEEQDLEGSDAAKLVPVTESIRYRRRAQSAEKKAETLSEQLAEANQRIAQMSEDLDGLKVDRALAHKLAGAGAIDLEAAMLVAKAKMDGKGDEEIDACVERLKREKTYLFGGSVEAVASRKTAGLRDRAKPGQTALEQAAARAARTGKRGDLQHYLKLRRAFM